MQGGKSWTRIGRGRATPGVGGACYDGSDEAGDEAAAAVTCLTATQLAEGDSESSASTAACAGSMAKCVFVS